MNLNMLEPKNVLEIFYELCSIPHGSTNVKAISDYCVEFARRNNLRCRQDDSFNVIIWKDGTTGYENSAPVILQGHLDMVAVKDADVDIDMEKEGLRLDYSDGYLFAKGTSLGGDDGIAVAYTLAVLKSKDIPHPPIEAVFTVDEEIGMLGATALDVSDLKSRILINIDSEEEGILTAGCAGGARFCSSFKIDRQKGVGIPVHISFSGLKGGHSGVEIDKQRANANILLGRILNCLDENVNYNLVSINGGEKDNAIAVCGDLKLLVPLEQLEDLKKSVVSVKKIIKHEYEISDASLQIILECGDEQAEGDCYSEEAKKIVTDFLAIAPNGVQKMSDNIKGLVQTSLNLGEIRENNDSLEFVFLLRSSMSSEKQLLITKLARLTQLLSGTFDISGDYPSWEYRADSPLRDVFVSVYERLYNKKPQVEIIHAGLECGIIGSKLDNLDCISFGPDILDIHTTKERLDMASVERTWKYLLEVLKELR